VGKVPRISDCLVRADALALVKPCTGLIVSWRGNRDG